MERATPATRPGIELTPIKSGGGAMRDPHDTVTIEIPGETAPPPAPPRDSAAVRRLACGYQDPKTAASCRNCRHLDRRVYNPDSLAESVQTHCKLHRFPVALGGRCQDHEE